MVAVVQADISPLLDAITASDEARVIEETLDLLGPQHVPPSWVAARVAIPAAWAGGDGHPLLVLGAAGRVAEWLRELPVGPEPGAEVARQLAPALPLVQGCMAVANRIAPGLAEPHPDLPTPLTPFEVKETTGKSSLEALREAFARRDRELFGRVLMGFYRVGADYRELLTHLYITLAHRYPVGGHPLIFAAGVSRVLDMADWGIRVPPMIHWLLDQLLSTEPDEPFAQAASAYAAEREHDLAWVQKRLQMAKEEAAGSAFRRSLVGGDAASACDAVLDALRGGASPRGVASGIAAAAAERLLAVADGDAPALDRAAHTLLYAHSVHVAMSQTQDPRAYGLLYTAAAAVNAVAASGAAGASITAPASTPLGGGLMAPALLRSLEHQLELGDVTGALTTARRYISMSHPPRSLAGTLGSAASRRDPRGSGLHTLPLVTAAAEEYLTQPGAGWLGFSSQSAAQSPLLTAAVRLAAELPGDTALAGRVADAVARRVAAT
jgi:hypothetical protein